MIHIIEDNEEKILESENFAILLKLFSMDVKHLVYNRNYRNAKDDLLHKSVPKHLELVSFVHSFFPNAMPDILRENKLYV